MGTQSEKIEVSWNDTMAAGLGWVLVALVSEAVVTNAAYMLLGFTFEVTSVETARAMARAMNWLGMLGVFFSWFLAAAVWKTSNTRAPRPGPVPAWARASVRIIIVAYALAVTARVVLRLLWIEPPGTVSWVALALWIAFVLLGYQCLRWTSAALGERRLAREARLASLFFVLTEVVYLGLNLVREQLAWATESIEAMQTWDLAETVVTVSLAVILLVWTTRLLYKTRTSLLRNAIGPLAEVFE